MKQTGHPPVNDIYQESCLARLLCNQHSLRCEEAGIEEFLLHTSKLEKTELKLSDVELPLRQ